MAASGLSAQLRLLLASLLIGGVLGLSWSVYRHFWRRLTARRQWAADALWSLLMMTLVVGLWFVLAAGQLRPLVFVWMAVGAAGSGRFWARRLPPPAKKRAARPETAARTLAAPVRLSAALFRWEQDRRHARRASPESPESSESPESPESAPPDAAERS